MRIILTIIYTFVYFSGFCQIPFQAVVADKESGQPLPGATAAVRNTSLGGISDENGFLTIENVPDGKQILEFAYIGYETQTLTLTFPLAAPDTIVVMMKPSDTELEEVVVSSTRSTRTIADIPTRIEFIAGEELEEKANMKPGDIRMLLSESTGIQTQQTSATSANASIRIQGLDGRYTQILKDGFPLYAGFSGGLGLLQTPPLDLKQVEIIKGSSSTLYGGGAIAGLVDLVSKTPEEERELRLLLNGTTAGGLDINGFYGEKYGRAGVTLYLARNSNEPYDPADIGLSAIPKFERYTANPRLFVDLDEKNNVNLGLNFITEDRTGGDMLFIEGKGDEIHSYFEENNTDRFSTQFSFTHRFTESNTLSVKNSISYFKRVLSMRGYEFNGIQNSTFTEVNYVANREEAEWIGGLNLWTDDFAEKQTTDTPLRDYRHTTVGAFVQYTARLSDRFQLETGLRGDHVLDYGFALLPRVSLLYKASGKFSSRVGGGLGYKTPTVFTEESESIQFRNVLPVTPEVNTLEKSYGMNWDFTYRTALAGGAIGFSVNQLFFYTRLDDPLFISALPSGDFQLVNLHGHMDTKGTETNLKLDYGNFKLFIGYTFTDTKIHQANTLRRNPLTPRHRLNNVLMYEEEEKWKIGLEGYYFGSQVLGDGTNGKEYWILGFMLEHIWEQFSLFLNFENFTDSRQTRFDTIYSGTLTDPVFRDIYAPVDGFVINGGIKLNL